MKRKRITQLLLIIISIFNAGIVYSQESTMNTEENTTWYDGKTLTIEGKGWENTNAYYERLPGKAEGKVTKDVWWLSHHTAGLSLRFTTNSSFVKIRWVLWKHEGSTNMPPTSVSGIDVYAKKENGEFIYLCTGFPRADTNTVTVQLIPAKEYIINLSLYNGVKSIEIGIPKDKHIAGTKIDKSRLEKTIVFYGTSITQGGCASRPGMAFTTIVGRKLDVPIINLGFSGNGKMEMEMEELLAELNPSVYVLDCIWNMNSKMIEERVAPFVLKLRESKPNIPIVLAEDSHYMDVSPTKKGKVLRTIYKKLVADGVEQLYFLSNKGMLGTDGEATVDGVHPSDLGMVRMSVVFTDFLRKFVK